MKLPTFAQMAALRSRLRMRVNYAYLARSRYPEIVSSREERDEVMDDVNQAGKPDLRAQFRGENPEVWDPKAKA